MENIDTDFSATLDGIKRTRESMVSLDDFLFAALTGNASAAVLLVRNDCTIRNTCPRAAEFFGVPKDDLIDRHTSLLVPKKYREKHTAAMEAFFENPRLSVLSYKKKLKVLTAKGTVERHIVLIPGRQRGICVIAKDLGRGQSDNLKD